MPGRPRRREPGPVSCRRAADGFTLVEVIIAVAVLAIALAGFSSTMIVSLRTSETSAELALANQRAQRMVEALYDVEFDQLFRQYNDDAKDDVGGAGTAPGNGFAVPGLAAQHYDSDGLAGEISFATPAGKPGELREDVKDDLLGFPRDLNGDGKIDDENHATDYQILPVRIVIRWAGANGDREYTLHTTVVRQ